MVSALVTLAVYLALDRWTPLGQPREKAPEEPAAIEILDTWWDSLTPEEQRGERESFEELRRSVLRALTKSQE